MPQPLEKTLQRITAAVSFFLIALVAGVGGIFLYQNRNTSIDLSPSHWISNVAQKQLSNDDIKGIKVDPQTVRMIDYQQMSRDAWKQYQATQPQAGWSK